LPALQVRQGEHWALLATALKLPLGQATQNWSASIDPDWATKAPGAQGVKVTQVPLE
jgi:hypothetical protein